MSNRREDCGGDASENKFTLNGEKQAEELSKYLSKVHREKPFTAIFTSGLWRTSKSIEGFTNDGQKKPAVIKDDRLNECSGGEVGCYSNNKDAKEFISYLKLFLINLIILKHSLVGHSRKGYDLLKRNLLGEKFGKKNNATNTYLSNCEKSGRWYTCESKVDPQIKYVNIPISTMPYQCHFKAQMAAFKNPNQRHIRHFSATDRSSIVFK